MSAPILWIVVPALVAVFALLLLTERAVAVTGGAGVSGAGRHRRVRSV